jgi:hypothetical protein
MSRGPLPQPGARRRNAPTIQSTSLPADGRKGRRRSARTRSAPGTRWWRWAWRLPQAAKWDDGALYAVARRAQLEDDLAALEDVDLDERSDVLLDLVHADEDIKRVQTALRNARAESAASRASPRPARRHEGDARARQPPRPEPQGARRPALDDRPERRGRRADHGPGTGPRLRAVDPQCRDGRLSPAGWRGPEFPGEFPTLGYAVADLIQATCAIPDGDHAGEPYLLTDEQLRFLLNFYRIDPAAKRDAGPASGAAVRLLPRRPARPAAEVGQGPARRGDHLRRGAPRGPRALRRLGRRRRAGRPAVADAASRSPRQRGPDRQRLARALPMIELGALRADIPDTGKTRINLPAGADRAGHRVGGLAPRAAHHVRRAGPDGVVDRQNRGRARRQPAPRPRRHGRPVDRDPERVGPHRGVRRAADQRGPRARRLHRRRRPRRGSVRNKAERRRMLRKVYGDSWWVDLDRIDGEIVALLERDPAQAERWFLNRKRAGESAAFDPDQDHRGTPEPRSRCPTARSS